MYSDEKIKEEKLKEYTQALVIELKKTSFIMMFADLLRSYMPKYNELKHFNAARVATKFLSDNKLQLGAKTMSTFFLNKTMVWYTNFK